MAFFLPYIILLVSTFATGVYRWVRLSTADKWLCALLGLTIVQESIAYIFESQFHDNFYTYHFYTPIELLLIAMYFDRTIKILPPYYLGLGIGLSGVVLSVLNSIFLEPLYKMNTHFLLFEGWVVIILCLFSFYNMLVRERIRLVNMSQFWITLCFLFYYSLTYMNFGLYGSVVGKQTDFGKFFALALYVTNLVFYIGINATYARYTKLVPSGE